MLEGFNLVVPKHFTPRHEVWSDKREREKERDTRVYPELDRELSVEKKKDREKRERDGSRGMKPAQIKTCF